VAAELVGQDGRSAQPRVPADVEQRGEGVSDGTMSDPVQRRSDPGLAPLGPDPVTEMRQGGDVEVAQPLTSGRFGPGTPARVS